MREKINGFSLVELLVVIGIIAILTPLGMVAVRAINKSFTTNSSERVISAMLSYSRAIAAREQKRAGVRFQKDREGKQYAVVIIRDLTLSDPNAFQALDGYKPKKLSSGVMSFYNGEDNPVSIIFSSSGRLAISSVRVMRKSLQDKVFNNQGDYLLLQDDYSWNSEIGFIIYDMTANGDYKKIFINRYTGAIIK